MAITTSEYIAALNDLASREMRMQLIYSISAGILVGPWRESLAAQFEEHQRQEIKHADIAFRRITALGGTVNPKFQMPPTWESMDDMLSGIAELEEEGIRAWKNLLDKLDENDAFRYTIEDILAQEQHHLDETRRWQKSKSSVVKEDLHIHLSPNVSPVGDVPSASRETETASDETGEVASEDEPGDPVQVYPVVGESRRLKVRGLNSNYFDEIVIGEAWQDESGQLHGTGLCRAMLFEPFAQNMYLNSAAGLDTSPLAVLAYRLSLSPFICVEWEDSDVK